MLDVAGAEDNAAGSLDGASSSSSSSSSAAAEMEAVLAAEVSPDGAADPAGGAGDDTNAATLLQPRSSDAKALNAAVPHNALGSSGSSGSSPNATGAQADVPQSKSEGTGGPAATLDKTVDHVLPEVNHGDSVINQHLAQEQAQQAQQLQQNQKPVSTGGSSSGTSDGSKLSDSKSNSSAATAASAGSADDSTKTGVVTPSPADHTLPEPGHSDSVLNQHVAQEQQLQAQQLLRSTTAGTDNGTATAGAGASDSTPDAAARADNGTATTGPGAAGSSGSSKPELPVSGKAVTPATDHVLPEESHQDSVLNQHLAQEQAQQAQQLQQQAAGATDNGTDTTDKSVAAEQQLPDGARSDAGPGDATSADVKKDTQQKQSASGAASGSTDGAQPLQPTAEPGSVPPKDTKADAAATTPQPGQQQQQQQQQQQRTSQQPEQQQPQPEQQQQQIQKGIIDAVNSAVPHQESAVAEDQTPAHQQEIQKGIIDAVNSAVPHQEPEPASSKLQAQQPSATAGTADIPSSGSSVVTFASVVVVGGLLAVAGFFIIRKVVGSNRAKEGGRPQLPYQSVELYSPQGNTPHLEVHMSDFNSGVNGPPSSVRNTSTQSWNRTWDQEEEGWEEAGNMRDQNSRSSNVLNAELQPLRGAAARNGDEESGRYGGGLSGLQRSNSAPKSKSKRGQDDW